MTTTAEQKTAITTLLSTDLSTVTDDRLIELCLLHRSAPDSYPVFIDALDTEIGRRFTALEIADNDVMFSVLQNFANQFISPIPFFQQKMLEMSASVNRDIWFTNNLALFTDATNNSDLMAWLVTQPDVLTKTLHNQIALPLLAQSMIAATAILTNVNAVALFKDTPNVWETWTQHSAGMTVIAQSSELMTYVSNNTAAMTAVAASSVAMTAVAASSTALSVIVNSTPARNALMGSNTTLQDNRVAIYNTVKASWTKQAGVSEAVSVNVVMGTINAAVISPAGFVFASLGYYNSSANGKSQITHPVGEIAAEGRTSSSPKTLANLDAVSFNGATFKGLIHDAQAYAELWIPPA